MRSVSRLLHPLGMGSLSPRRTTASRTSCLDTSFSPAHGTRHSISSHSTTPRLYTSTLSPEYPAGASVPSTGGSSISGAIHSIVPTGCHRPVKPSHFSSPPHCGWAGRRGIFDNGAALPKSHSFAWMRCLTEHHANSTLLLLTSRWANPASWRYAKVRARSSARDGMSRRGMLLGTVSNPPRAPSLGTSASNAPTLRPSQWMAFHRFPPWQNSVTVA
mmetsp:Transcript_34476/g.86616  ORF Transcript_34476/g.86616 Transcript_34476/m.86616 type:complete len:217 (-) Transcript_34476:161-811(-)